MKRIRTLVHLITLGLMMFFFYGLIVLGPTLFAPDRALAIDISSDNITDSHLLNPIKAQQLQEL